MRTLKTLVIVMGVMLVGGFALLVALVAGRVANRGATTATAFTAPAVELPAGARIETMAVGADRIVVAVLLADGNRQLLVFDLATGRRLGLVPLRAAP